MAQHYFFTVERRSLIDGPTDEPGMGFVTGAVVPSTSSEAAKAYVIHREHFENDAAGVAAALYADFDPVPTPDPTPDPPPEPAPEPTPDPPPDPAPDPAPDPNPTP